MVGGGRSIHVFSISILPRITGGIDALKNACGIECFDLSCNGKGDPQIASLADNQASAEKVAPGNLLSFWVK